MKSVIAIIAAVIVAGCGADGAPERPTKKAGTAISPTGARTSVTVSGTARIGVEWKG